MTSGGKQRDLYRGASGLQQKQFGFLLQLAGRIGWGNSAKGEIKVAESGKFCSLLFHKHPGIDIRCRQHQLPITTSSERSMAKSS